MFQIEQMSAVLSALISILALFGVTILCVLILRSFIPSGHAAPVPRASWNGHISFDFYNHPPQAWAAP